MDFATFDMLMAMTDEENEWAEQMIREAGFWFANGDFDYEEEVEGIWDR